VDVKGNFTAKGGQLSERGYGYGYVITDAAGLDDHQVGATGNKLSAQMSDHPDYFTLEENRRSARLSSEREKNVYLSYRA